MMMMKYSYMMVVVVVVMSCSWVVFSSTSSTLAEECSQKLPEVMTCVGFASGKESTPGQKCCDSVKGMKESNPACLCFLIQQIHNGTNPTLQKMNIQEARLLQLPSACSIANASIADCPKLLKLAPNSPDAAIFNNVTNTVSTPATTGGGSGASSTTTSQGVSIHEQQLATTILIHVVLLLVIPSMMIIN